MALHAQEPGRFPDARCGTRAGGGDLCGNFLAPHHLAGHVDRRRVRRTRRHRRSRGSIGPTVAIGFAWLRFRCDHRRVRGPPASAGHRARQPAHVAALPGRRIGAGQPGLAECRHRPVPGHAAVLPSRCRRLHPLQPSRRACTGSQYTTSGSTLMDQLAQLIVLSLAAATRLVYPALGELVAEKSGVLNLGVEGMMLAGAVTSFIVAATTHSAWLGVAAGMAAGAALSLIFGVLTLSLMANQVASGLALSLFGIGLSAFVGLDYVSVVIEPITPVDLPVLTNLPVVGKLLFGHNPLVYLSIVLLMAIQWFLYRTRAGLIVRAVGESPQSAHAIGFPVARIRYCAVMFGGACAGMGGAYMAVAYTPLWVEGMTAGRGWIALALVVFAAWKPWRILPGAYLFGGVTLAQFQAQGIGVDIPSQYLSMWPDLSTIVVLAIISRDAAAIRLNAP